MTEPTKTAEPDVTHIIDVALTGNTKVHLHFTSVRTAKAAYRVIAAAMQPHPNGAPMVEVDTFDGTCVILTSVIQAAMLTKADD